MRSVNLKLGGIKMYLFVAHYMNMDNSEQITRKIECDEQFMENSKECYVYAMRKAYDMKEKK